MAMEEAESWTPVEWVINSTKVSQLLPNKIWDMNDCSSRMWSQQQWLWWRVWYDSFKRWIHVIFVSEIYQYCWFSSKYSFVPTDPSLTLHFSLCCINDARTDPFCYFTSIGIRICLIVSIWIRRRWTGETKQEIWFQSWGTCRVKWLHRTSLFPAKKHDNLNIDTKKSVHSTTF